MTLFRKHKSKGEQPQEFQTTVRFLDDSEPVQLSFTKETVGQYVLDKVCETLNLEEKDYFGLRFVDGDKQRHWLDPTKTVYKQLKGVSPCVLCFRVKFYPADPMKLHEEITRYYLFLQLRRDLHHGRLLCSSQDANHLAAYIIQSEVGDYDIQDHPSGYVTEFKMLPNQTAQQEQQIQEIHKTLIGQVPAEAEANFLKKAASLDTYGVDPHKVKDQKGNQMYLGVTHQGIMTFHGSKRTQIYKWSQIKKLAFEGKTFIAHVNVNEKHQPIGFKCLTVAACKYLWRCAVEQQFFFTLPNSTHIAKVRSGGSLFSRGSKFRFSGRCQNEAYHASEEIKRKEPDFQRTSSLPNFARRSDGKVRISNMSLLEDKTRKGFNADTLPHISQGPSISNEPPHAFKNRNNSANNRDSQRLSQEVNNDTKESQPVIEEKICAQYKTSETAHQKVLQSSRPKLKEIAKQSSKDFHTDTETEQRQMAIENESSTSVVSSEPLVSILAMDVPVLSETVTDPLLKDNSMNVHSRLSAEVVESPIVKAPTSPSEDKALVENIIPVLVHPVVQSEKVAVYTQNGIIPIIITSASNVALEELEKVSETEINDVYDPEETIIQDNDEMVAKSLEEQVAELEKQFQEMQERNHVDVLQAATILPAQTAAVCQPNNVNISDTLKESACSNRKIFAFTFFSLFLTFAVTICIVIFSDVDHPVMNEARMHLAFLEPVRDFVTDKYHQVVNMFL